MNKKILFLGAGKMASAIAGGLTGKDDDAPKNIMAFDPNKEAIDHFIASTGAEGSTENVMAWAEKADIVILAVKPQQLKMALYPLKGKLEDKLIISIVAGVDVQRIADLSGAYKIVRAMPNTPALIGEGFSAFATSENLSESELENVNYILTSIGKALPVEEKLMNAVTGLSGSGPAYVFEFIMALVDGGVREGLPRTLATEMALQTIIGAAKLVALTGEHPAILRDQVISPGGTTACGVAALDRHGFKFAVTEAVAAATKRATELGGK